MSIEKQYIQKDERKLIKGKNVIYQDDSGKFVVDQSLVHPEDKRNFKAYTMKALSNTKAIKKADSIDASGYTVVLRGHLLNSGDSKAIQNILKGKAIVSDNFLYKNRDQNEIEIRYEHKLK
jgi:hypothetical protein